MVQDASPNKNPTIYFKICNVLHSPIYYFEQVGKKKTKSGTSCSMCVLKNGVMEGDFCVSSSSSSSSSQGSDHNSTITALIWTCHLWRRGEGEGFLEEVGGRGGGGRRKEEGEEV